MPDYCVTSERTPWQIKQNGRKEKTFCPLPSTTSFPFLICINGENCVQFSPLELLSHGAKGDEQKERMKQQIN